MRHGQSFDRFRNKRPNRRQSIVVILGTIVFLALFANYSVLFDAEYRSQLIFDIGFSPETIHHYLAAGHKVVGVNANPLIVIEVQELFQAQIVQSRLTLLTAGIEEHDHDESGGRALFFYVHKTNKEWSSFDPSKGCRKSADGDGFDLSLCTLRQVDTTSCESLVKNYGLPHYLRIHAEGKDWMCLESLLDIKVKPKYISIEAKELDWLRKLKELGYRQFKVVQEKDQSTEYGESAIDIKTSKRWRSFEDVLNDWKQYGYNEISSHWHATF